MVVKLAISLISTNCREREKNYPLQAVEAYRVVKC
jgi:hypothetical protein